MDFDDKDTHDASLSDESILDAFEDETGMHDDSLLGEESADEEEEGYGY